MADGGEALGLALSFHFAALVGLQEDFCITGQDVCACCLSVLCAVHEQAVEFNVEVG